MNFLHLLIPLHVVLVNTLDACGTANKGHLHGFVMEDLLPVIELRYSWKSKIQQ